MAEKSKITKNILTNEKVNEIIKLLNRDSYKSVFVERIIHKQFNIIVLVFLIKSKYMKVGSSIKQMLLNTLHIFFSNNQIKR